MKAQMLPILLGLVSLAAGESLIAGRVNAGEVCNYRNQVLAFAQANYRTQEKSWVSEGWWLLNPGDCISYPDEAVTYLQFQENSRPSRPYQQRSQEVAYSDGAAPYSTLPESSPPSSSSQQEVPEALAVKLCVVQDRFTAFSAATHSACKEAGGTLRTFLGFGAKREIIR